MVFVGGILAATWLVAATGGPLWRVKDIQNRVKELDRFNELMNRFDELGKKHDALSR